MKKKRNNKPIKQFKGFLGEIERFTDKTIPFWVIVLAIMLILDNPFWTILDLEHYQPWVSLVDALIVLFFFIDLIFKWYTVRQWKKFLKIYWLDILAIFPFYLITRAWITVTALLRVGEELGEGQKFLHEFLLLRETELVKEARIAEEVKQLRETKPFIRALRSIQRFLRFIAGKNLERKDIHYKKRKK